jgi:transposase
MAQKKQMATTTSRFPTVRHKRGRPLNIDWQESEAELQALYNGETQPARRIRLKAFWLLHMGKSLTEVSTQLDIRYRTLQRWVAWYRHGGLNEVFARTTGGKRIFQAGYLTPTQEAELKREANKGRFASAGEVADWVQDQWGIVYQPGSIYSLLKGLGITFKKVSHVEGGAD